MNTIPTTFNDTLPSYTAVGGTERGASTGLSAVLLGRGGGRYPRRTRFQELEKIGFDYIISMEGPQERYDVEELSGLFPQVRFILLKEAVSLGEQINLAASELSSSLFFVLRNDLRILHSGGASRMEERLRLGMEELNKEDGQKSLYKRLCTVPLIQNSHFETLPTLIAPAVFHSSVKPLFFAPAKEGQSSLYPFDGVGIYDRSRFIRLGGFDRTLKSAHWQLMDFGFRAYLWGEQISATQLIRLSYDGETPPEDSTADESYRRFYLKNLAPVFRGDSASIPLRCFPGYFWRSGKDLLAAWNDFSQGRQWVKTNRYRFRSDARAITELWEDMGELSDDHTRVEEGRTENAGMEVLRLENSKIEPENIEGSGRFE
ncbi:MAG: hypothetical protein LBL76_00740 [Treponema sp.]|jgi:hypothetical protein|nr:hypothetical protein [Treponema sp.]